MTLLSILAFSLLVSPGQTGAETFRLEERLSTGHLSQVSCRVDIEGKLSLPADKDNPSGKQLAVKGRSEIDYNERILVERNGRIDRTVRSYRRMDFSRTVGDQVQQSSLRSDVRTLVIMRHNQFEVPFSPHGPLTWGEIDLVRTDVFTPALAGLLPGRAVASGDSWQADNIAMRELTDLDRIEQATLTCKFEGITTLVKRRQARVSFKGEVKGIGEDGPSRHELDGFLYFDLAGNFLSYLNVRGTQHLVDKAGQSLGQITGSFVLTRQPLTESRELSDNTLRGRILEPTEENTLLLYESQDLGVRFLYPRRWRVAGVNGRQIALDEKRGSGLLITLDTPGKAPTATQFHRETQDWLKKEKATILRADPLKVEQGLPNLIERFAFDAQLGKDRVIMDYHVLRQTLGGATLAARLLPAHMPDVGRDVGQIVRSMQISRLP